jgi:hypothetical protein
MQKAKLAKAAKLNATRAACKKRSLAIVPALKEAEKQLAKPRAVRDVARLFFVTFSSSCTRACLPGVESKACCDARAAVEAVGC